MNSLDPAGVFSGGVDKRGPMEGHVPGLVILGVRKSINEEFPIFDREFAIFSKNWNSIKLLLESLCIHFDQIIHMYLKRVLVTEPMKHANLLDVVTNYYNRSRKMNGNLQFLLILIM